MPRRRGVPAWRRAPQRPRCPGTMSICAWLACKSGNQAAARALWCVRPGRAAARRARGLAPTRALKRAFQCVGGEQHRQQGLFLRGVDAQGVGIFYSVPIFRKGAWDRGWGPRGKPRCRSSASAWVVPIRPGVRPEEVSKNLTLLMFLQPCVIKKLLYINRLLCWHVDCFA